MVDLLQNLLLWFVYDLFVCAKGCLPFHPVKLQETKTFSCEVLEAEDRLATSQHQAKHRWSDFYFQDFATFNLETNRTYLQIINIYSGCCSWESSTTTWTFSSPGPHQVHSWVGCLQRPWTPPWQSWLWEVGQLNLLGAHCNIFNLNFERRNSLESEFRRE